MAEEQPTFDSMVNDLELVMIRTKGVWNVKITGIPLPKDIHHAQKLLADVYRAQRRKIADNYNASKQKFKELIQQGKEAERVIKTLEKKGGSNGPEK